MKFKTSLVFWIFLVVVFSFMDSHKDMNVNEFRIPTTKHFLKWGKCETFKGVNCVVYWWWMQRKGARKQSGAMPTCYCLLLAMSSQLSVLSKLCIMNTLLRFLLLLQFCRSLRNISLGDCILSKSNVIITVGWLWWRHQRALLFSFASGPPNPKPTTACWSAISLLKN